MTSFNPGANSALFFENFTPFSNLFEQDRVKEYLLKIVNSNNIPHAFLFSGKVGTGKETAAIELIKLINFTLGNKKNYSHSEKIISNLSEPYVKYIFPLPRGKNEIAGQTAYEKLSNEEMEQVREELEQKRSNLYYRMNIPKSNAIKVNSIREINKFLSLQQDEETYRLILISRAEYMGEESQNTLLKNLEEPPERTIFILTTSQPELLRETIKSRCWTIQFDPLSQNTVEMILIKNFNVSIDDAKSVAHFADGSIVTALELLENDIKSILEDTINLLRNCLAKRYHSAQKIISPFLPESQKRSFQLITNLIILWLNDVQKNKYSINNYYFENYRETLFKFNQKFPDSDLNTLISKIENIHNAVESNCNMNVLASNLIFEIASLSY